MNAGLHVLRADSLRSALSPSALQSLPSETLAAYLSGRRWFGAKGTAPTDVAIIDIIPVPWGPYGCAVTRVRVRVGEDAHEYQLPLTVVQATSETGPSGDKAIATVESSAGEHGFLIDATEDASFRQSVGDAFERGASFRSESTEWDVEPVGGPAGIAGLTPRLGSVEQSNTSVTFGNRAILKFFRRLETGENPDLEIGAALTEAGFDGVPKLLGRMRFATRKGSIDGGMLQQLIPGSVDAWSYALDAGRKYFSAPATSEPSNSFTADAESLGRVTRAMHEALGAFHNRPAFDPRPATLRDVRGWVVKAKQSVDDGLDLLATVKQRGGLTPERSAEADVLIRRRDHFYGHLDEIALSTQADAGALIRHHGDYHLGQVLHAANGKFYVIDFEGEPARALSERREPHSALRDVAGMLRSFAYVAATLASEAGATVDIGTRELRNARWERDSRDAFVRGYLAPSRGDGAFLPKSEPSTRQLIALFETEKVFYELAYELNNRPDWVGIPMRGISKLLVGSTSMNSGDPATTRSRPARG